MRKRRGIAITLIFLMLVTLFPMDVWAYVGTKTVQTKDQVKTGEKVIFYGGSCYKDVYLENDYIRLDLVHMGNDIAVISQPKRTEENAAKFLASDNYAVDTFSVQFGAWGGESMLKAREITMTRNKDSIVLDYNFTDDRVLISVTYTLVNLNEGYTDGHSNEGVVTGDDNYKTITSVPDDNADDKGRTWGIMANMSCDFTNKASGGANFRWYRDYKKFNAMGHRNVFAPGTVKMSRTTKSGNKYDYRKPYTFDTESVDITGGLGRTDTYQSEDGGYYGKNNKNYITEVFMDSYFWANPFVATGQDFYKLKYTGGPDAGAYDGVNGFENGDTMPQYVTYNVNGDLRVQSAAKWLYKGDKKYDNMPAMLVGFRDLYKKNEDNFTPSDKVAVAADSNTLGVFKTDGKYTVYALDGGQNEKKLINTYGKPVARYRGKFQTKTDANGRTYYEFANQVVALSDTVTASWGKDNESGKQPHFYLYQDGTVDMYMIRLNTPKFKFYEPKDNSLKLGYSDGGIKLTMDPDKNKAAIYTDIPNTTSKVDTAVISTDGNLLFEGEVTFDILFGRDNELTMKRLSYGMSNREFKVNGVETSGSIDTANMIGIELAKIEGEVNTFKNEERYAFSVEVNAFDLFEGEAELELKRLRKTGDLVPNKMYIAGYAEPGIPLVPPLIVARLTGGGGGFDGLADTINGDFLAIPPLTLSMEGGMSMLHVFNGKAKTTIGPSKVQVELKDVNLCKLPDLITSLEWHLGVTGQQKLYNGMTYTGLNGNGGMSAEMKVPKDMEVFQISGSVDLNGFAGADNIKRPTSIYVNANVVGDVTGKVCVPKKWKLIGGKTLASAKVDFALGGETAISVRNVSYDKAVKSAIDNLHIYGGMAYTGNIGKIYSRIYYVIPSTVGGKVSWGEPDEWDVEEVAGLAAVQLYDENGEAAGIGYMELYLDDADYAVVDVGNVLAATDTDADDEALLAGADVTSRFELTDVGAVRDDAAVLLTLMPADGVSIQDMAEGLHIYDADNNPVELRWMPDVVDEATDDTRNYNAVTGIGAGGKDTIFVSLGTKADCAGKYSWKVVSEAGDFTGRLYTQNPQPTVQGTLAASAGGGQVTAHVDSPVQNEKYVLSTYLGSEQGSADYLIDRREISETDVTVDISGSGTELPTGEYYVSVYLEQERQGDFDGDGVMETALIPVDNAAYADKITYTNTVQPDAPSSVMIDATGNEIMNARWKRVADADGYKINIYTVDAGGNAVDTARSYNISADKIDSMTGISFNGPANEYSLDMALTVGGNDADGNSMALDADSTYRVGVQAYNYLTTDENGNGTAPVYSSEAFSQDEYLPEYEELELTVKARYDSFGAYEVVECDADTGMYYIQTDSYGYAYLEVAAEGAGSSPVEYSLTRLDTGEKIADSTDGRLDVPGPEFSGTLMLKLMAENTVTGDVTVRYITLQKDDTAPILTLDKSNVVADSDTGKYVITGHTEPGADVILEKTNAQVVAEDDGTFMITGTLSRVQIWDDEQSDMVDTDEFEPLMADIYARDRVGNRSANAAVIANVKAETVNSGTVKYDLQGGSWKEDYTAPALYSQDAPLTFPTEENVERKGYIFGGWYDNPECTGDAVVETTASQSGVIELYAKWVDENGDATTEGRTTESGTTESRTTESGTTESRTTESGTTESGTTESGTTESRTTETETTEALTTERPDVVTTEDVTEKPTEHTSEMTELTTEVTTTEPETKTTESSKDQTEATTAVTASDSTSETVDTTTAVKDTTASDTERSESLDTSDRSTGGQTDGSNPGTGDPFRPVIWIVICILCGSGVIVVEGKRRKRHK